MSTMNKLWITLLLGILTFVCPAQNKVLDNLKNSLPILPDSKEKVDLLNTIALEHTLIAKFLDQSYYDKFSKQFHQYSELAKALAKKLNYQKGLEINEINELIQEGNTYVLRDETDKFVALAPKLFEKSQKMNYKQGMGIAEIYLAAKYLNEGNQQKRVASMFKAADYFKESGWKTMEGQLYIWNSRFVDLQEGTHLNDQAFAIGESIDNPILMVDALLVKGEFYSKQGEFPKALGIFNQCLKIQGNSSHLMQKARVYMYTCELYTYQDNYRQAKKYIDLALNYCKKYYAQAKDEGASTLGWQLYVAGKVDSQLGEFQTARSSLQEALSIFEKVNSNIGIIMTKAAMAQSDIHEKKYQKARENLETALPRLVWYDSLDYSTELANLYTTLKEYDKAEKLFFDCIPRIKKINSDKLLKNAYEGLYTLYKSKSEFQKALEYHEKFVIQKEKILGIQKSTEMIALRFQSQIEQQEIENTKLKQINKLKEAQIKQRDVIVYFTFAGIALLLIFAYVLIRANSQKKKANQLLAEQKEEIASHRDQLSETLEELKATQTQLVQSEKMASLGQLTAGIAHEINNPINFVYAGIDSLRINIDDFKEVLKKAEELIPQERITELEDFKEDLDFAEVLNDLNHLTTSIKTGAKRTKEIVAGLRTFSRLDEDALKDTDIHENLDSTLVLLNNQLGDRIEMIKKYGDIPHIKAFPGPLNQVFMNILVNAIQAIEDKGTISIATGTVHSPQSKVDSKDPMDYGLSTMDSKELSTIDMIFVSIKDTGRGMSKSVLERIFEPFFTTKEVGKGTGLGLSISHSIIEKHNGKIEVESEVGKGTEFRIILPVKLKKEVTI